MTVWEAVAVVIAGVFAGGINTVVGSGTLVTFPVLLAVGYPPVVANVSNSLGLVPGSLSGAWGYREELKGQGDRIKRLLPASILGGIIGAILLVTLPAKAFTAIVPVLIVIALVLVVIQPWLNRKLSHRRSENDGGAAAVVRRLRRAASTAATSVPRRACWSWGSWACSSASTCSG